MREHGLEALFGIDVPALAGSIALFDREKTASSFLQLLGAGSLATVVMTHLAEAFDRIRQESATVPASPPVAIRKMPKHRIEFLRERAKRPSLPRSHGDEDPEIPHGAVAFVEDGALTRDRSPAGLSAPSLSIRVGVARSTVPQSAHPSGPSKSSERDRDPLQ